MGPGKYFHDNTLNIVFEISNWRIANNYTMEEAGKRLGVNRVAISRWETGKSVPKSKLIWDSLISNGVKITTEKMNTIKTYQLSNNVYNKARAEKREEILNGK